MIAAKCRHGVGDRPQQAVWRGTPMIIDIVRWFSAEHGDRAISGGETALDVQRLPGVGSFVLADAVGKFPGLPEGRFVDDAWDGTAKVYQYQFHRPTDGRVGAPALSEDVVPTIDIQGWHNRPINDHQWGRNMRRTLHAACIAAVVEQRLDGGDHHR